MKSGLAHRKANPLLYQPSNSYSLRATNKSPSDNSSENKRSKIQSEKENKYSSSRTISAPSFYSSSSWNSSVEKYQIGRRGNAVVRKKNKHKYRNSKLKMSGQEDEKLNRVSAKSKVNFEKLTDAEMNERYVNMFNQLQSLRQQYKKQLELKEDEELRIKQMYNSATNVNLIKARNKLKNQKFQIEECSSNLLESFAAAIADKKLNCQSLEFALICALIRKVTKQSKGPIAMSQDFQDFFISSKKAQLVTAILGSQHSVIDRSAVTELKENHFVFSTAQRVAPTPVYVNHPQAYNVPPAPGHPLPMMVAFSNHPYLFNDYQVTQIAQPPPTNQRQSSKGRKPRDSKKKS